MKGPLLREAGAVLHLIPRFRKGGAEHVIRALAERCQPAGIIATSGGDWIEDAVARGIEVVTVPFHPSTPGNALRSFLALRNVAHAYGVGIIHSHHRFTSLIGRAVAAAEGLPFVSTVHDLAEGNKWLTRAGIGGVVTVFSEAVARHLQNRFGVADEKITRLPMGVFDNSGVPEAGASKRHHEPVIAFAGRLAAEKGIFVLLDAVTLLQGRADFHTLIIGDGEEREKIIRILASRGLEGEVTLMGFVDEVRPLFAACDVVVVPSLREGFGRVVLEALAGGVAVVASDTGGIRELVRDRQNGILVPPGDAAALAAAVQDVLQDRGLAATLREGARATPLDGYSIECMTGAMNAIYARVLARSESRRGQGA